MGSAAYMNRHEKAIPVDEAFLYKYFIETGRRTDGSGINGRKSGAEMEDLDSDEADEFLGDIDNHVSLLVPFGLLEENFPDFRTSEILSLGMSVRIPLTRHSSADGP